MKKPLLFSFKVIFLTVVVLGVAFTSCKKNNETTKTLKRPAFKTRNLSLSDGLIGYWPLAGNNNDLSGNEHTTTLHNVTKTYDHLGNPTGAYLFNGTSSKITVDDAADLRLYNTDYTISAWVRADDYNTALNSSILSKRGGSSPSIGGYMMGFSGTSNVGGIPQVDGGTPRYYNGGVKITHNAEASVFDIGVWHNYLITYSLSTQTIQEYFDGTLQYTYTGVTMPTNSSYPLNFGFDQATGGAISGAYFKGAMSDIRIYNRVLSSDEILQIYNEPYSTYYNTLSYTLNESQFPYVDGNLRITVNGSVIDNEYGSTYSTLNIPWVDLPPPSGTPFTVQAYSSLLSTASQPTLTLTITVTGGGVFLDQSGQVTGNPNGGAYTVFSQTIPAAPGASLLYNGMLFDYGSTYNIIVTTAGN